MNKVILSTLAGILIAVLSWCFTTFYSKLVKIEEKLVTIELELAKVNSAMLDEDKVRELIEIELLRRGL